LELENVLVKIGIGKLENFLGWSGRVMLRRPPVNSLTVAHTPQGLIFLKGQSSVDL